ncbi:MAG: adenylate/guanylate cyclase domain-containing response regulator, partial [Betaproteobacteria bacterium]
TPMNAILGYCDVLIEEAAALGVEAFLPDLRHLHAESNRMLERINDAVPPVSEDAGRDLDAVRTRARESLFAPSRALLNEAQSIFAKAGDVEAARPDFERLVSAANKLMVLVEGLARPADGEQDRALSRSVQQTLNRLRPAAAQPTSSGGTLLVVDDNALNRDLLTRQLVREGYNVLAVGSGREALETLRLHDFDLILLDVIMPEMDGVQLLDEIERDANLSGIPVIMMSALDEIGGVARCLEKGAADYLIKPADPVLLRARVRSTLQIRHLRADLRSAEAELEENAAAIGRLARSLAPPAIAASIDGRGLSAPVQYPEVTAVVVRIEGVDALAARRPGDIAGLLAQAFEIFEQGSAAAGLDLTRIADRSFTAIVGATAWTEQHADLAADFALDVRRAFAAHLHAAPQPLHVRIGVHTGVLTTGLAGGDRLVFGLWGDAVSTADAIAACAPLGEVQLSNATCAKLSSRFVLDPPVVIDVPGRGHLPTRRIKEGSGPAAP